MGANRAKLVAECPDARLACVCDLREDVAEKVAGEHGCDWTTQYEDMLARDDIDVIGVMTPSGWHCDHALQAIAAGRHCFTTKPMDLRVAKCDAAIAAAKERGVVLAVDFDCRYNPANHRIRMALQQGLLGKPLLADLRMKWYRKQEYYDGGHPPGWRSRLETEGGSLANQGVHFVDLLLWFMGSLTEVRGRIATVAHSIETEDLANALLTFESGAWGVVQTTTAHYPREGSDIEISGDRGSLVWRDNRVERWETQDGGVEQLEALEPRADLPANIIEDMVAAVRDGAAPLVTGEEGRKSTALLEAVYESARTGEAVTPR